jgi:hypothetical protein
MKVLVCGDRNWEDEELIQQIFNTMPSLSAIVHGNCRGADKLAGKVASRMGIEVFPIPAQWKKYGKKAGPIRNSQMLEEHPDIRLIVALHDDIDSSKGTSDMILKALSAKKRVDLWSHKKVEKHQVRKTPDPTKVRLIKMGWINKKGE